MTDTANVTHPTNISPVPLESLRTHPLNANVMSDALLDKLTAHIRASGRYPPLIVRPMLDGPDDTSDVYQLLDGHHRWAALQRLAHTHAQCVIWEADDEQATLLMATLNRLEGHDDPHRRSKLIGELHDRFGKSHRQLGSLLPEPTDQVRKLLALRGAPPPPSPPTPLRDVPTAVHFFLTGHDRQQLEHALDQIGGPREQALMQLVGQVSG